MGRPLRPGRGEHAGEGNRAGTAHAGSVSQVRLGGRDWPRQLDSAAQITGPLILACGYAISKLAVIGHLIPASWDRYDSLAGVFLFAGTVLLVAWRQARIARHARLVEQQRADWASRSARGGEDAAMPVVRDLAARVEVVEMQAEIYGRIIGDITEEAGVGHLAGPMLRIVRPSSSRPVA